jgi:hypothetical protein
LLIFGEHDANRSLKASVRRDRRRISGELACSEAGLAAMFTMLIEGRRRRRITDDKRA